eukprot:jgi/Undpi1/616/HiC_scaffold_10.g04080.m1
MRASPFSSVNRRHCAHAFDLPSTSSGGYLEQLARGLAATGTDAAEWTYRRTSTSGKQPYGPSDWHLGYPDCGLKSQSPIDIAADLETVVESSAYKLQFFPNACKSDKLFFQADERVWEVKFENCTDTPHLNFKGETYNLAQIHIHSPSEHMIGASEHAAEIHWVHVKEGTDDDLLVVGVLFDTTKYGENVEIQNLWDVLDIGTTSTKNSFITRVYDVMPSNPVFSHYMGSLTTPPCTQGVKWIVMSDPVTMSEMQLEEFRTSVSLYQDSKVDEQGNTNRPWQALNDREVFFVHY